MRLTIVGVVLLLMTGCGGGTPSARTTPSGNSPPATTPSTARSRRPIDLQFRAVTTYRAVDAQCPAAPTANPPADRQVEIATPDECLSLRPAELVVTGLQEVSVEKLGEAYAVLVTLFPADGTAFEDLTRRNANSRLAFLLGGTVLAAPTILEPVRDGKARFSNNYTESAANDIARRLRGEA